MSWFQTARDWTAFVLSLTSLTTAGLALRNSLVGPQPVLGEMAGETVTILPSSEFRTGSPPKAALPLLDENRHPTDFPVALGAAVPREPGASPKRDRRPLNQCDVHCPTRGTSKWERDHSESGLPVVSAGR